MIKVLGERRISDVKVFPLAAESVKMQTNRENVQFDREALIVT